MEINSPPPVNKEYMPPTRDMKNQRLLNAEMTKLNTIVLWSNLTKCSGCVAAVKEDIIPMPSQKISQEDNFVH